MNTKVIGIVIAAVVLIGGGAFAITRDNDDAPVESAQVTSDDSSQETEEEASADNQEATETETNENDTDSSDNATTQEDSSSEIASNSGGVYVDIADYNADKSKYSGVKKVLNFYATWCPSCQTLEKDLQASLSDIPNDIVLIKVDYDSNTDLRQKYGVTSQHTMVQIDDDDALVQKWLGGSNLASITSRIQ